MNKDKMKMIEEMAKETGGCDYPQRDCENCWCREKQECSAYAYAKDFYNAGYRKLADDEIVIKKIELERLERSNYQEGVADGIKEIKDQYDALRARYATLWAENQTLRQSNEMLTQINFKLDSERMKSKQETAREILQELHNKVSNLESCLDPDYEPYYKAYKAGQVWDIVRTLAKEYGIELE